MTLAVIDSSAVIAWLRREPGGEAAAEYFDAGIISAVNVAEVVTILSEEMSIEDCAATIEEIGLEIIPFDRDAALAAGALRPATRRLGLSLGDRACLALARTLGVPALTADRAWLALDLGVEVRSIR